MRAASAWHVVADGIVVPVSPQELNGIITRTVQTLGIQRAAGVVGRLLDGHAVGVTPSGELTLHRPPGAEPSDAG